MPRFSGIGIRRSYSVDKEQLPSNHLIKTCPTLSTNAAKDFLFENVEVYLAQNGIRGVKVKFLKMY